MITYVLILTLFGGQGTYSLQAPAITSVPGFQSREACVAAAHAWVKQLNETPEARGGKALCVPTKLK